MNATTTHLLLLLAFLLACCARVVGEELSGCDASSSHPIRGILDYGEKQELWPAEEVDHVVSCVLANHTSEQWTSHPLFPGLRIRSDLSGDAAMSLSLLLSFQPRISPPRQLQPHASSSRGRCACITRSLLHILGCRIPVQAAGIIRIQQPQHSAHCMHSCPDSGALVE